MLSAAIPAGFLMGFVGSMPPTGPIAVLVLERGLAARYRDGLGVAAGAAAAESLYTAFALFGMTALFTRYPSLEVWALRLGIVVLVAVGARFAFFTVKEEERAPEPSFRLGAWMGQFGLGFSLVIANPVILLTWSGAVAALCSMAHLRFEVADKFAFVAAACLGVVGWFAALLATLRRFEGRFTLRAAQWLIRAMGALLLVMAAANMPRALR
jgi:threonine/homoserine/homoserine lactone efflux protein